jgi:hypothetical protein
MSSIVATDYPRRAASSTDYIASLHLLPLSLSLSARIVFCVRAGLDRATAGDWWNGRDGATAECGDGGCGRRGGRAAAVGDGGWRDGGGNSCVNMGLWEIGEGRHGTIPHSITTKLWDCHPSLQEAYVAKVPYTTNVT